MRSSRLPRDDAPNDWSRLLAARRAGGARLIDLTDANPTRVGLSGVSTAELEALAAAGAARYEPEARGLPSAREAVAAYYGNRDLSVSADDIVLTASTSEAYAHLFRLLADPGGTFLIPAPSYPLFEPLAALEGVRVKAYRLAWDGAWHLDLGSLESAMADGASGVIVVQPNHPTGSCLGAHDLAAVEALCERHGAALISDEVFGDFAWPKGAALATTSLPSLLGDRRVPTFVLSGLSKVCGMPQMKLGWIAVAGPAAARADALRGLEWIADLFLSVASPVQMALPRLLAGRHPWQARVHERIAANLESLRAAVARQPALTFCAGEGGWVAVLRVPRRAGEEAWVLELLEQGVIVHPGHFYDFNDEAWLVLSLIVPVEDFREGLSRIDALAAG